MRVDGQTRQIDLGETIVGRQTGVDGSPRLPSVDTLEHSISALEGWTGPHGSVERGRDLGIDNQGSDVEIPRTDPRGAPGLTSVGALEQAGVTLWDLTEPPVRCRVDSGRSPWIDGHDADTKAQVGQTGRDGAPALAAVGAFEYTPAGLIECRCGSQVERGGSLRIDRQSRQKLAGLINVEDAPSASSIGTLEEASVR